MEKLNVKTLIESVLSDMANNTTIDTYILKIQMIARLLKNKEFSLWINKELNGYGETDIIPTHRILQTRIVANLIIDNGVKAMSLSNHEMPLYTLEADKSKKMSTINVTYSIAALSKLISSSTDNEICYSITEYEKYLLNTIYDHSNVLSAHKPVMIADFEYIIHKFKSTLLDLFMELNDTLFNKEIDFDAMSNKKEIEKIVNQTINTGVYIAEKGNAQFSDSTIVGGSNNKVQINSQSKEKLSQIIDKIEDFAKDIEDDREDLAAEIAKIKMELDGQFQQPIFIKSALNAIKGIAIGVSANNITPLVNSALEILKQ